jgi:hypothetical protein
MLKVAVTLAIATRLQCMVTVQTHHPVTAEKTGNGPSTTAVVR